MKLKFSHILSLVLLTGSLVPACFFLIHRFEKKDNLVISKSQELQPYYGKKDVVMIASTGRSGSSMLAHVIRDQAPEYHVLKTHILPPDDRYKGKIIFIFSNPDKAAESILHITLHTEGFGEWHFANMETADRHWPKKMADLQKQTEVDNLLAYDALGCAKHLEEWLYLQTQPCHPTEAHILAIKYEHLWEPQTVQAIKEFLGLSAFKLKRKKRRGYDQEDLFPQERAFKNLYNLGSENEPKYAAYDKARVLWEKAPPFQYYKRRSG